jgi:arsenate reductase
MSSAGRPPFRVLVLCTGNSARSQIAEAILATAGGPRIKAASAGSRPAAQVNPWAVAELARHGIEWAGHRPQHIDDVAGQRFELVITVCDNARDACPFFAGAAAQVHWGLPDPAEETEPEAARAAFARTWEALQVRVERLLALPLESLSPGDLTVRAQAIHDGLTTASRA